MQGECWVLHFIMFLACNANTWSILFQMHHDCALDTKYVQTKTKPKQNVVEPMGWEGWVHKVRSSTCTTLLGLYFVYLNIFHIHLVSWVPDKTSLLNKKQVFGPTISNFWKYVLFIFGASQNKNQFFFLSKVFWSSYLWGHHRWEKSCNSTITRFFLDIQMNLQKMFF